MNSSSKWPRPKKATSYQGMVKIVARVDDYSSVMLNGDMYQVQLFDFSILVSSGKCSKCVSFEAL